MANRRQNRAGIEAVLRYHESPSIESMRVAVEYWQSYARGLASRYYGKRIAIDDLSQVAVCGLIKAIERYEPDKGAAFTAFAQPTILGEIKRHFRDHSAALRIPRTLKEQVLQVQRLNQIKGYDLSAEELAQELGISIGEAEGAMIAGYEMWVGSLDRVVSEDDETSLGETIASGEPAVSSAALFGVDMERALAQLLPSHRAAFVMYHLHDMTQLQISTVLGVSQMQVSRYIQAARDRLAVLLEDYKTFGITTDSQV